METPEQAVARIVAKRTGKPRKGARAAAGRDALGRFVKGDAAPQAEPPASDISDVAPDKRIAVLDALAAGHSIVEAAASVDRDRRTLWDWRQADEEYADSFAIALLAGENARKAHRDEMRAALPDKVLRVLHDALDGESLTREQLTAAIFLGKSELGMSETSKFEVSGPNGGPIAHAEHAQSREALEARARALITEVEAGLGSAARAPAHQG